MIVAGPCGYSDKSETNEILETAAALKGHVDYFRCKLWMGGTRPDKYIPGIGENGISTMAAIRKYIPVGTEVQTPYQYDKAKFMDFLWIGARNSYNYGLFEYIKNYPGLLLLKRGLTMSVEDLIGMNSIFECIYNKKIYWVERGIVGNEKNKRWHIDFNSLLELKYKYPKIFKTMILDCSHSAGDKEFIPDIYAMGQRIGIENYMFEATLSGKSKTDQAHMLSVIELKEILNVN